MNNKIGFSHIEAVLSFVLFIGFLIFAFFFFSPFSGNKLLDSSIDYAFREVNDFTEIEIESYSIVINASVTDDLVSIDINHDIANAEVKVEDGQGNVLGSWLVGDTVHFDRAGNRFVIVRFSKDFSVGILITGVPLIEGESYAVSSSEKEKIYSESRFLELNASYHDDYSGLKEDLNLPNRIDFGFSLLFDDVTGEGIVAERSIPENLEVLANKERVEIIREDGEIVFSDLIIRVW